MTTDAAAPEPPEDAYALLSKPTLQLTPAEIKRTIEELRRKRHMVLTTGKPDKTVAEAKAKRSPKIKPTDEAKAAITADILAQINLDIT